MRPSLKKSIIKAISTSFYLGYIPFMPGTFGSLAGLLLFLLVKECGFCVVLFNILLLSAGFLASGRAEKIFGKKDSQLIVIDETAGMFLALSFLPYYDFKVFTAAFIAFRVFDIFKPYPALALQKLKGSSGVMLDDIVAGLYANIILQVLLRAASCRLS